MKKDIIIWPEDISAGINYILVEMIEKKTVKVMVVLSCR
jgi:hypothetical protein